MNRKVLRVTGAILTGVSLMGDPASMVYATPVAGVTAATQDVMEGTANESPTAGISLVVSEYLAQSNEAATKAAAEASEQVSENEAPVVESEYSDIAIAQVDNYVNVRSEASTESDVLGKLYNNSAATILETTEDGW